MDFLSLRNNYNEFSYNSYEIKDEEDKIVIEYDFEIKNLCAFHPRIEILKKNFKFKNLQSNLTKKIVFYIGMVEAISYYKCACPEKFYVKCGNLSEYDKEFFEKLYYLGLGEFRYKNNISVNQNEFLKLYVNPSACEKEELYDENTKYSGVLIPVGGGKDSVVTMELLKNEFKDDALAFCIGDKKVSKECANIAGFDDDKIVVVNRSIDKNLIDLNSNGFLNGHTPFSAIVAFITYLVSFLLGKKYIALSNENSANESNVEGEKINHQYSKTFEFESDFREFVKKNFTNDIEYFSFLRPISEFQISYLFSKYEKYHSVFKSCNVGSKTQPWYWCCECPKCLFVYIILSPFLYKEKLIKIFGEDLFEKKELLKTFIELCGFGEIKPFECVGTYREVREAVSLVIKNFDGKLPYLLEYYKENFELVDMNLLKEFNNENYVPDFLRNILKEAILGANND